MFSYQKNDYFFSSAVVEINSQRIRRGFAMLCYSTETARRLRCKCAETALRIDSQWSRRQICKSVRAAKLFNKRIIVKKHSKIIAKELIYPCRFRLPPLPLEVIIQYVITWTSHCTCGK